MTRVDFYFNAESKLQLTCRIAAKAIRQQIRVLVFAPDELVARTLNRLMWTVNPTGFIPHCIGSDRVAALTPIVIASDTNAVAHDDLLLNLDSGPPPAFGRFRRLVEIVSRDDAMDIKAGRERFRYYKDQGYPIVHHDLSKQVAGTQNE
jgi:DNA polymerase-3 subunit chi